MRYAHLLAAGFAAALTAGTATAATVTLSGGTPQALGTISGQDFTGRLGLAGVTTLWRGDSMLALTLNGASTLTFSLVAAESGFSNSLNLSGMTIISENADAALPDFTTGALAGQTLMSGNYASGTVISDLLSFTTSGPGGTFFSDDDEFGVFSNAAITGAGGVSSFFLSFDDDGANSDDNHDDIIVRVDISPVPLPAAGWLLVAGMGGLVGMRRFRRA